MLTLLWSSDTNVPYCLYCNNRHASMAASQPKQHRRVLQLLLGDDDDNVAATAVRQQMGGGAPAIEVFQNGRLVYREVDGAVVKPAAAAAGSGSGGGSKKQQRPTHRAVASRTPLVKQLDWVALRGTGGETELSII